ncbi:MAG: ATP-binding protein [Saccharofermentanales bacterium]
MLRQIITIDEALCNGCALCTQACHEGAIALVDGKARLIRDDYCDGLGNCLPACPTGAITFEQREAAAFDEEAVKEHMAELLEEDFFDGEPAEAPCGCPSMTLKTFDRSSQSHLGHGHHHDHHDKHEAHENQAHGAYRGDEEQSSNLAQWPIQIQLVPVGAPYLKDAHLLIAADCAAFAHASFNRTFMRNKVTLIGCPKLDYVDYSEKLTEILKNNTIKSVTVVRMEVPCCGGLSGAAVDALRSSGKMIPWNVITLSTDGTVIEA